MPAMSAETSTNQTLSQKAKDRKSTKPIMEKRRRARINNSLSELKNLILDALKKDNARHSKLEKADILEMTVKHLQNLQRQQMSGEPSVGPAGPADPDHMVKYRSGFNECANEVSRFLARAREASPVDSTVRHRLLSHLANCLTSLQQVPTAATTSALPIAPNFNVEVAASACPPSAAPSSASPHILGAGMHLVPTRLPSGEIAFLLPSSGQQSVSGCPTPPHSYTTSPAPTSTGFGHPLNVLGSTGILSPAASDRSCSPQNMAATLFNFPAIYEPISPAASKYHHFQHNSIKLESMIDSRVWRPW